MVTREIEDTGSRQPRMAATWNMNQFFTEVATRPGEYAANLLRHYNLRQEDLSPEAILGGLYSEDPIVRIGAIMVCGTIFDPIPNRQIMEKIMGLLFDPEEAIVRSEALYALSKMPLSDVQAAYPGLPSVLTKLLSESSNPYILTGAIELLLRLEVPSGMAVPELLNLLEKSEDPQVRGRAAYALGWIGGATVLNSLRWLGGRETNEDVRAEISNSIERISSIASIVPRRTQE
ncbi:HEAT repeat domain-containing protein [Candidatus Micrarchaeota archaeon]|nr:HEAT repeat domain-containing protein [Candidatus Micrarchaeota archaeon]